MNGKSELIRDGVAGARSRWFVHSHGWGNGWVVVDLNDQHEEKFDTKAEALEYIRQVQGHRILHRAKVREP